MTTGLVNILATVGALMLLTAIGCETGGDASRSSAESRLHEGHGAAHSHSHDHDHAHDHGHDHDHGHADDGNHVHEQVHADDHAHLHPVHDPDAPCTCAVARLSNGWCRRCNVGYVAGDRVGHAILFETLDPHGHDLDLGALKCKTCRAAVESDAFCAACGMGFVEGKAYFTRLTHGLAQGKSVQRANMECPECRLHAGESGWCDRCSHGMVGLVAISDRAVFDRTVREFAIFRRALERATVCELCACAMVVHGTCPRCQISHHPEEEQTTER